MQKITNESNLLNFKNVLVCGGKTRDVEGTKIAIEVFKMFGFYHSKHIRSL